MHGKLRALSLWMDGWMDERGKGGQVQRSRKQARSVSLKLASRCGGSSALQRRLAALGRLLVLQQEHKGDEHVRGNQLQPQKPVGVAVRGDKVGEDDGHCERATE